MIIDLIQDEVKLLRGETHHQAYPARHLKRMKREDEPANEGKKTWDNIMGALKKAGNAVKEGFKKHVEEPIKKFAEQVKGKMEDMKRKKQANKGGKDQQQGEPTAEAPSEEHEEAHAEK